MDQAYCLSFLPLKDRNQETKKKGAESSMLQTVKKATEKEGEEGTLSSDFKVRLSCLASPTSSP